MKDVNEVLEQKEADAAHVRHEIEILKIVSSLLSDGLSMKDARELLQQKKAEIARVRHEIESLKIVAPLLSEELTSGELTERRTASAVEEAWASGRYSEATGMDGSLPSLNASPRPTLWERLKRKA